MTAIDARDQWPASRRRAPRLRQTSWNARNSLSSRRATITLARPASLT
jgi:hypothetical protein